MITVGRRATRLDLAVRGGDPIDVAVPILDALGLPLAATGWTAAAIVRESTAPGAAVLHTFAADVETVAGAGRVRIAATPAVTRGWLGTWPARVVPWDVLVTDTDQIPHPLTAGWVRLYTHL